MRDDNENKPDNFSRLMGSLDGLPDGAKTQASTIRVVPPLGVGGVETYLVQTYRQKDVGDHIFIEHVSGGLATQLVLPPLVVKVILRQHDQLTTTVRKRTSKRAAAARKDAGILPGFMQPKKSKAGS